MSRARKTLAPLLLLTAAAALPGCLKARETDRALYDPQNDEFRLVMVLENINGNLSDLDYLNVLRQNKDHLIAPFMPGDFMGYAPWYIRLADFKTAKVTFVEPRPGDMQPIDSTASLNTISIHPGAFFLQNNGLCYYHAISVPGATIDTIIAQTQKDQLAPLKKAIQGEIDRRKKGGRVHTWPELIAQEVKALKENSTDHPIKPLQVLEEASLDMLVKSAAENKNAFTRKADQFQLALPLTPSDRDGTAELWSTWKKAADTAATADAAKKADNPMLALQRLPAQHITLTPTADGILLSVDVISLYNSFATAFLVYIDSKSTDHAPDKPTYEARFAQSHNWLTNDTPTTAQILKDFDNNTLKSYPSPAPVPPGAGLKPQPK